MVLDVTQPHGMMSYETWHWRIYNVMRRSMIAVLTILAGISFVGDGTGLGEKLGIMDMEPGPPRSTWDSAGVTLLGIALLAMGIHLCRLRTYRPDLGDVFVVGW